MRLLNDIDFPMMNMENDPTQVPLFQNQFLIFFLTNVVLPDPPRPSIATNLVLFLCGHDFILFITSLIILMLIFLTE